MVGFLTSTKGSLEGSNNELKMGPPSTDRGSSPPMLGCMHVRPYKVESCIKSGLGSCQENTIKGERNKRV